MMQHPHLQPSRESIRTRDVNHGFDIKARDSSTGLAPWHVSECQFPSFGEATEKLKYCVRYAILAPSSHNTQPWRFTATANQIALYADRTRSLPVVDPNDRELIISCGAALANLSIAIRHFGYSGELTLFPQPNDKGQIAIVELGQEHRPTRDDEILFRTIPMRRTNRNAYEDTPISRSLFRELCTVCTSHHCTLTGASDGEGKFTVARLVGQGDRQQMANPTFRAELAHWMRPAKANSHDGIPCFALNMPGILDFATPVMARLVRTFDMGSLTAARDGDLANASAMLAVLSTPTDMPADWLAAGMALEHVMLVARAAGVWASFLNQPIEVPELRLALRELMGCPGYPQILLRMGYGQESEPTPRRSIEEVLSG
jgi:Putative TM nitroreductase/Nitroreductase family